MIRPGGRLVIRILSLAALCLTLAGCERHALVDPDTVGPGYVTGGGTWDSGGGITVAARALERNGATVLCGAWATDRQSALSLLFNEEVMEAGALLLGGRPAIRGLGFMARVPDPAQLAGGQARCIASGLPWQPGYAAGPEIRLPPLSFVASRDRPVVVRFRPGPRPVPNL